MSKIIKLEDGQLVAEDPDTGERVPVSFEALEAEAVSTVEATIGDDGPIEGVSDDVLDDDNRLVGTDSTDLRYRKLTSQHEEGFSEGDTIEVEDVGQYDDFLIEIVANRDDGDADLYLRIDDVDDEEYDYILTDDGEEQTDDAFLVAQANDASTSNLFFTWEGKLQMMPLEFVKEDAPGNALITGQGAAWGNTDTGLTAGYYSEQTEGDKLELFMKDGSMRWISVNIYGRSVSGGN